jgi:hypothetical protein
VQIHLLEMNTVMVVKPLHENYDSNNDRDSLLFLLFLSFIF